MPREFPRSARRAAAQQLSGLRSAGVTGIVRAPRPSAALHPPSASPAAGSDAGPGGTKEPPACAGRAGSLFESNRSTLSRTQREEKLALLAARVAQCKRCSELAETRTQTVFGVGNPQARILFLGEAPGADEDRQGVPFVGAAGQLLNRILEASKLARGDIYICNILRCRPPGNRTPLPEEACNCREYLDGQIETIDPDYIVCLGSVAAKNLLATPDSIGKLRGRWFQHGRARVMCTYHPAYLLRNPAAKKDVWADMKFLMRELDVEL